MTSPTDANSKPATLCTYYVKRTCTLSKKGHCPSRDRKNANLCTTNGNASWCGVAMRSKQ